MTALSPRCSFSGTALKTIACITMLVDHIGASCIEAGLLLPELETGEVSGGAWNQISLYQLDRVLRFTGRLAFPIFCFLLVEGFVHTHDVKNTSGGCSCLPSSVRCPLTLRFPHALCTGPSECLLDAGAGRAGHGRSEAF